VQPCGLGSRDSLRLESRLPLYGNDLDDTTSPLEAGLGWAVKLDRPWVKAGGDFLGRSALVAQKAQGLTRVLTGFRIEDRAIARHGYAVVDRSRPAGEQTIGTVTSGGPGISVPARSAWRTCRRATPPKAPPSPSTAAARTSLPRWSRASSTSAPERARHPPAPNHLASEHPMSNVPSDLRYTPDHEWLRPGASCAVGITAFAVEQLGDITLVDLPAVGTTVEKGARFGTIESVKSVSDLYAPVSGTVTAVNGALKDSPEAVNADCYAAWMVEITPSDAGQIDTLLSADAYTATLH
jgi:glycine cleavage system H protein